jgi:hypothetical protein
MEEHAAEIFNRNLPFMRDLLMNGELVRLGLIDGLRLQQLVSGRPSGIVKGLTKVFHYVAIETWLTIWSRHGTRSSVAAAA